MFIVWPLLKSCIIRLTVGLPRGISVLQFFLLFPYLQILMYKSLVLFWYLFFFSFSVSFVISYAGEHNNLQWVSCCYFLILIVKEIWFMIVLSVGEMFTCVISSVCLSRKLLCIWIIGNLYVISVKSAHTWSDVLEFRSIIVIFEFL